MYLTLAKPLSPFIFSKIVFIEPNHDGTFASWSSFDSVYAPDNKGKEDWRFSSLYQLFTIDRTMLKCRGNLPSSDRQTKFVDFLWTPRMSLQNLMCNCSLGIFAYFSSMEGFLLRNLEVKVLKVLHISEPYSKMGFIVWSNVHGDSFLYQDIKIRNLFLRIYND